MGRIIPYVTQPTRFFHCSSGQKETKPLGSFVAKTYSYSIFMKIRKPFHGLAKTHENGAFLKTESENLES